MKDPLNFKKKENLKYFKTIANFYGKLLKLYIFYRKPMVFTASTHYICANKVEIIKI